LPFVKTLIRN
ncbi:hypothetical protein D046_2267B, partial [Vibrio parahaemolyticus V-223/04]